MTALSLGHLLIALVAPRMLRDEIAGDFEERFRETARRYGRSSATAAFYRDVLASLGPLALLRCENAARDSGVRAVALGFAACAAVYAGQAAVERAGVESLLMAHAVVAIVTLAACAFATTRPFATALTMYAAIVVSALLLAILGPERRELGAADFYWPFARIALTIAICSSFVRSIRRRSARQDP
jgi:hypothetical protein